MEDLKSAFDFALENNNLKGAYNLTAPVPTTNYGFTKALAKALKRPAILPLPKFVLGIIFGEGAKVLTGGQRAVPKKLLDEGFKFKFKNIEEAIGNLAG